MNKFLNNQPARILLKNGLSDLGVACDNHQEDQLLSYLDMLIRWNKAYNLTAIQDPMEMIRLHVLDSISISHFLNGQRFIDIGTGAGLPGIPLSIINPDKHFTLLDSNGKKTRFLFQVKIELGLKNVKEVNSRVERFLPDEKYHGVLSRAFSSLSDMLEKCSHLVLDNGCFFAMKGRLEPDELGDIPSEYQATEKYPIEVPGVVGRRHLVKVEYSGAGKKTVG